MKLRTFICILLVLALLLPAGCGLPQFGKEDSASAQEAAPASTPPDSFDGLLESLKQDETESGSGDSADEAEESETEESETEESETEDSEAEEPAPEPETPAAAPLPGYDETQNYIFFPYASPPENPLMYVDGTVSAVGRDLGADMFYIDTWLGEILLYVYPGYSPEAPAVTEQELRFYYAFLGYDQSADCPAGVYLGSARPDEEPVDVPDADQAHWYFPPLLQDPEGIQIPTDQDIKYMDVITYDHIEGDSSGNVRFGFIAQPVDFIRYVISYYNTYFKSDSETHYVFNLLQGSILNLYADSDLFENILPYSVAQLYPPGSLYYFTRIYKKDALLYVDLYFYGDTEQPLFSTEGDLYSMPNALNLVNEFGTLSKMTPVFSYTIDPISGRIHNQEEEPSTSRFVLDEEKKEIHNIWCSEVDNIPARYRTNVLWTYAELREHVEAGYTFCPEDGDWNKDGMNPSVPLPEFVPDTPMNIIGTAPVEPETPPAEETADAEESDTTPN